MKSRVLEFGDEGRSKIRSGVKKLANAVESTLGPCGRNVIIERDGKAPLVTKDGVTVAKEIKLIDPVENLGAEVIKEVSMKAAKLAGDGTTTATVLAATMYTEGLKAINAGMNPVELKRGMDNACQAVVKNLRKNSKDVVTNDEIKQVATISANNDDAIGTIIAEAMDSVGKDGVIQVQESRTAETSLEIVEGMQIDRGFVSPYFVSNQDSMTTTLENPMILLCDKKISNVKEVLGLLETCSKENKPLLIIADDIDGEALAAMVVNKARGVLNICAIKAPGFGDRKLEMLEDIATLTGGSVVSTQKGMKLERLTKDMLGTARTVTVSANETVIVDGGGDADATANRINIIEEAYEEAGSDYDKQLLKERMSKLVGGVAVLHVGAPTEIELQEKADRVDDALCATRAAVEEGVIPGGGIALINASAGFVCESERLINFVTNHPDQNHGHLIVINSCREPFAAICSNAGKNADAVLAQIGNRDGFGYDARQDQYVDMMKEGIIDPTKVAITALELATSAAGTLITTECVVSNNPEEKEEEKQPQPMMY